MATPTEIFTAAIARVDHPGLDVLGLIQNADLLSAMGQPELTLTLYKYWLLTNPEHVLRHVAAFNCGCLLLQRGDFAGAIVWLRRSTEAKADFHPARLNLATAYERAGDAGMALQVLREMATVLESITPQNLSYRIQGLRNIGRMEKQGDLSEAALRQAVELDSTQHEMLQHWMNRRQSRCVWPALQAIGVLKPVDVLQRMAPLSIAALVDDPMLQLAAAKRYSREMIKDKSVPRVFGRWLTPNDSVRRERLKIAYLSSDFCGHAVGYLMSDVFDHHDRKRYEISVFNIGPANNDAIQQRIKARVDKWHDIQGMSDRQAAALLIGEGIDILLDMNGHTNYQRTGLLAMRPAPVVANWLGYPGTMGSDYHNYIIADNFIIPPSHERFYSERVLRLPCYQPNGKLSVVPPVKETRAELGLPSDAVVFCCFNGSVKITEPVFSRWMTILQAVPRSVLWLRGNSSDEMASRLRAEAVRRGVEAERLVFLSFRANTEYLGCHRYADVFLDTFPYGAHTTASDALRMGVPIVTLAGMTFASRVCGSLCHAAGFPDLVCESPDAYVRTAIELGSSPVRLTAAKAKLAESLRGGVLFDSANLVSALEGLFEQAYDDYLSGRCPEPEISTTDTTEWSLHSTGNTFVDFVLFDEYEGRWHPG